MTNDNHIQALAEEMLQIRRTQDRPARRRWDAERRKIARQALQAQQDARHDPSHEKTAYAASLFALDAACTLALQLESNTPSPKGNEE